MKLRVKWRADIVRNLEWGERNREYINTVFRIPHSKFRIPILHRGGWKPPLHKSLSPPIAQWTNHASKFCTARNAAGCLGPVGCHRNYFGRLRKTLAKWHWYPVNRTQAARTRCDFAGKRSWSHRSLIERPIATTCVPRNLDGKRAKFLDRFEYPFSKT